MYLVTGGAGFIGSNLVAALCARGAEVMVLDWLGQDDKWRNLAHHPIAGVLPPPELDAFLARRPPLQAVLHLGAISATTATVTDSTFTDNDATYYGGAIYASTGTITRSRFTRNTAGEHGGAVILWSPTSDNLQQLRRNTFTRNRAGAGGAILLGSCGPAVSRSQAARVERANRFSSNRATEQRRTNNIETGYCD